MPVIKRRLTTDSRYISLEYLALPLRSSNHSPSLLYFFAVELYFFAVEDCLYGRQTAPNFQYQSQSVEVRSLLIKLTLASCGAIIVGILPKLSPPATRPSNSQVSLHLRPRALFSVLYSPGTVLPVVLTFFEGLCLTHCAKSGLTLCP